MLDGTNSTAQVNAWIFVQSETLANKSSMIASMKFIKGKIIKQDKSQKQELSALHKICRPVISISDFS